MELNFVWRDYRLFPYEKVLGQLELERLLNSKAQPTKNGVKIICDDCQWRDVAKRMTYFSHCVSETFEVQTSDQKIIEETANNTKRQSTRYSSHGLHEYRGKFNPQIVRAITNLMNLNNGAWVLDPFCGSGTVLVESALMNYNAMGIDINPMAVEIANAKVQACSLLPKIIELETDNIVRNLHEIESGLEFEKPFNDSTIEDLVGGDLEDAHPYADYLMLWFQPSILAQLLAIRNEINDNVPYELKKVFHIVLSDILRQVSLQDPGDLRIRRLKDPPINLNVFSQFSDTLVKKMTVVAKGNAVSSHKGSNVSAILDDIRSYRPGESGEGHSGGDFDAAITSPPYANALPYIDTQRLSIIFQELCHKGYVRDLERELIGNREINLSERVEWSKRLIDGVHNMPPSIRSLCLDMATSVSPDDGFRRQNTPPLIFKYFWEMALAFKTVSNLLKNGGLFALVVGMNKAKVGSREFIIDTPRLLADLSLQSGFQVAQILELNTYSRFDIHSSNSIKSESLILLRKVNGPESISNSTSPPSRNY